MGSCATLNMASLIKVTPVSSSNCNFNGEINYGFHVKGTKSLTKLLAFSPNGSVSRSCSNGVASSVGDAHRRRSSLESLFCYDKAVPEERIEKPVGISLAEKLIGDNPRCNDCHAKGAVLCSTCSGSGLYVDSILESQGIIVKVRCLDSDHEHDNNSNEVIEPQPNCGGLGAYCDLANWCCDTLVCKRNPGITDWSGTCVQGSCNGVGLPCILPPPIMRFLCCWGLQCNAKYICEKAGSTASQEAGIMMIGSA